jgi:hypothetical protein
MILALPTEAAPFVIPDANDRYWQKQWYLRQIQAPEAWRATTITKDVIVAVIDAGIDISHPDLREAIWTNPREIPENGIDDDQNGFIDDVHGWNFVRKSGDVRPQEVRNQLEEAWSHGTFVASLIGARSFGRSGMVGVNQSSVIIPLVALDGDGFGTIPNVLQAIRYAVNQGASIINLSLAGFEDSPELAEMIQRARDAGVLVVAATGNGDSPAGRDTDRGPVYPACFDQATSNVVGVSGTDSLDQHASYANYGSRCTDLSAPGFELFGARPSYARQDEGSRPAERYLEGMTGTSLAAPLVSGVASLVKAIRPELTVDQLHTLLTSTTDNIEDSLKPSERGKMGTGRLNALKAVQAALVFGHTSSSALTEESMPPSSIVSPTSTEQTPNATWFQFTTPTTTLRWLVAPKPIWAEWGMQSGLPVASAFVKEGNAYTLKLWLPLSNRERVTKITPSAGQIWTSLVAATGTSPMWLLVSSKREMRIVRTDDARVLTVSPIKGLPTTAKLAWDGRRTRWALTDAKTKKVWEIDQNGRVTVR